MTAKTATRAANATVSMYDGQFEATYDCSGVENCKFTLCSVMPADGSEECYYQNCGSCRLPLAQYAALETLRNRITKEMKQLDESMSG